MLRGCVGWSRAPTSAWSLGYPARPPRGTLRTRYVSWCSGCDSTPVTVSVVDIVPVTRNARPSLPRFPSSGFPKHPAAWAPCPQPYAVGRDAPPELMVPARIHAVYVTTNQCGVVSRAELPAFGLPKGFYLVLEFSGLTSDRQLGWPIQIRRSASSASVELGFPGGGSARLVYRRRG